MSPDSPQGRWTIYGQGPDYQVVADGPRLPHDSLVPVVPCDDAAVERVAAKLAELQGYHVGPLEIDRRAARDLLRAAGETS